MTTPDEAPRSAWPVPPSTADRRAAGRQARRRHPRSELARLSTSGRDPLGILAEQDATRVQELVPLRAERMAATPFTFYRGTAAIMAADLAQGAHSGIMVASCGDAHVANFGLYASPQRTLVFDLNDFDEGAWAPWEWDVKRLVASIVIGGRQAGRAEQVVREAALGAVRGYAVAIGAAARRSPVADYFEHFDAHAALRRLDSSARASLKAAITDAEKRTGDRAARRLTERDADGRIRFVEQPPTMTRLTPEMERRMHDFFAAYAETTAVDIRVLLRHYAIVDLIRRVVGVGSVGTRCHLVSLQDGNGGTLVLQSKEAGPSVLERYGGIEQPEPVRDGIAAHGQGWRVVSVQRVLQAFSDPFLGHLRVDGLDYYVRQFHDMKGGVDVETLDDDAFRRYALACARLVARAHSQSPAAAEVAGYLGSGKTAAAAILAWSEAYAELSHADWQRFAAARAEPDSAG